MFKVQSFLLLIVVASCSLAIAQGDIISGRRIDFNTVKHFTCYQKLGSRGRSTLRATRINGTTKFKAIFFFSVDSPQIPEIKETPISGQSLNFQTITFSENAKNNRGDDFSLNVTINNLAESWTQDFVSLSGTLDINESYYDLKCSASRHD